MIAAVGTIQTQGFTRGRLGDSGCVLTGTNSGASDGAGGDGMAAVSGKGRMATFDFGESKLGRGGGGAGAGVGGS